MHFAAQLFTDGTFMNDSIDKITQNISQDVAWRILVKLLELLISDVKLNTSENFALSLSREFSLSFQKLVEKSCFWA